MTDLSTVERNILVVDDTPENLRLLARLLSTDYAVRLALSGELALKSIHKHPPDLILLDIRMPEMSGYDVCRQLKANPKTRDIPIIFLSALQDAAAKVKGFEVGGVDYITKPFQGEEVRARVRHQLHLRRLQQQLQAQQRELQAQNQHLQREIRDRQAVETRLQRTTSRLSTLIENLQAGILVEDETGQIVLANQNLCNLFNLGGSAQALLGQDRSQVASQWQASLVEPEVEGARVENILAQGQMVLREELNFQDGRILARDYIPIVTGQEPQGHLWQYRDITDRQVAAQDLLKTSQTLATFSESLRELHRLNVTAFNTLEALFEDYLTTGCQVLGFAGGLVSAVQGETYVIQAAHAVKGNPDLAADTCMALEDAVFCGQVIADRQTTTYDHIGASPTMRQTAAYQTLNWESYIGTPIWVENQIYGTLCFFSTAIRPEGFGNHEQEIIELMAQSMGWFIRTRQIQQQRQAAEAALKASEERFRQLAEHIESAFWIRDLPQEHLTYISPAYERMWGQQVGPRLTLQDRLETIHPEDRPHLTEVWDQQSDQGYDEEYRILRPDGQVRWLQDRAFPIRNEAGQTYRMVGIVEDHTERKRQARSLQLILEKTAATTGVAFFRTLSQYLAEALSLQYVMVSQFVAGGVEQVETLAFWQGDRLGDNFTYGLQGTPCDQVVAGTLVFCGSNVQASYPQDADLVTLKAESYLGVPLVNSAHQVVGHLAVLDTQPMGDDPTRDLIVQIFAARAGAELERMQVESAMQQARDGANAANRAKSEFLANMSHELRTPLNTILGFTQLMRREGCFDPQSLASLAIVNRSGEHLLDLINDVLEMSKIEAGRVSLHRSSFNLHHLLTSLEDMLRLRAESKGLALHFDYDAGVPAEIETDEGKLRQVLLNLLGNGIKFTDQGTVSLNVQVHPPPIDIPDVEALLEFAIADTGPGIAPEEVEQLFEPFGQTATGHRSQEGTGLGLPISQRFVRLMGGELTVATALDQGATFTFTLPVRLAQPDTILPQRPQRSPQRLAPNQPDQRILVVEDHDANRELLVRLLRHSGFQVKAAQNGQHALEIACQWHPHLIWMDIRMPVMDGYEATRQIKAAHLQPAPVIIALTASAFEDERERVIAAGCHDFVRKPFRHDAILEKMADYLPIRYLYGEALMEASAAGAAPAADISPADLSDGPELIRALQQMPPDWLHRVQTAAMKGADDSLMALIEQVPLSIPPLGKPAKSSANPLGNPLINQLTHWTLNFEFDAIIHLIQAAEPLVETLTPRSTP
ncbi:MAG: response regulator [Leptolyngbya sp. RL_3_1]|nr:response regulator [Leptolyngbya sp. RL_3_1]